MGLTESNDEERAAAEILGRKGGKAGRGAAKRRGNSEYYRALSVKGVAARKRKHGRRGDR